ncbi:hypothetical protein D3C74_500650 [compost metagenome]
MTNAAAVSCSIWTIPHSWRGNGSWWWTTWSGLGSSGWMVAGTAERAKRVMLVEVRRTVPTMVASWMVRLMALE